MMELYNPYIVPRHEAPPNADNHSEDIIYTDPNDVPMYVTLTPVQLAALPHPNYASRLLVALWVLLLPATILLALRLYLKLSRHRGIWWDDWILIGAWVCSYTYCIHGFSTHIFLTTFTLFYGFLLSPSFIFYLAHEV